MLPLAPTGEIEAVLLGPDGQPLSGATVELTDSAGRVLLRAVSDFDGYLLFDSVPYGDYRLRLGKDTAAELQLPQDLGGAMRVDGRSPSLRLGRVRLGGQPVPEPHGQSP